MTIKQLTNNLDLGLYDSIWEIWDYPLEDYLAASPNDIQCLYEALNKATETKPKEKQLLVWYNFVDQPELDVIKELFTSYIYQHDDEIKYSYYKLEDDYFLADSSVSESDSKFEGIVYNGFENGKYKLSKTIEENFTELLNDLQKDYEDTELFTNFMHQQCWQYRNPSPCEYILYYCTHRREKYVPAIIKFVRYYRKRYILANINLYIKGCTIPNCSTDFLNFDIYKDAVKDSEGNLVGQGKIFFHPENEEAILAKDFPLKVKIIDRHKALLLMNWDAEIPCTLSTEAVGNTMQMDLKANHIAAVAFAMAAKGKYRYASRADFVKDAVNRFPEFKKYPEDQLICAMNGLLQKNSLGDFTVYITNQGTMKKYIEGCYKKTKRGKTSTQCTNMYLKAMEYFRNL